MGRAGSLFVTMFLLCQAALADRRPSPDEEFGVAVMILAFAFVALSLGLSVLCLLLTWGRTWRERGIVMRAGYAGALLSSFIFSLPPRGLYDMVDDALVSGPLIVIFSVLSAIGGAVAIRVRRPLTEVDG